MAISPDGKLLVCSGSKENNVTFYSVDTSTGELYLKKEFLQGTVGYPGFTNFDFDLNTCQIIASAYRERYEEILTFLPNTNNDSFELRNELIADSSNSRSSLIDNTSIRMLDAHHFIYAGAAPSIPGTVYKRISVFTIDTIRNSLTSLSLFDSVKATFKNICVSNNREDIYFISNEFFHFRCDSTYQRYVRDSTLGRGNGGLCVTVSADDRFVFTGLDNSFSLYSRDSSTGNLSLIKTIKDGETGIQGLENISSLTISNDSKCLYIGTNSGIKYFSCDLQNNLLTYWGPVVLPCNNIALSYDNKTLIGATGNRIFVYSRDTVTGNLTKYDSLTCSHISPKKIAITNNGKYLFAFAFGLGNTGNGIEIFKNSPKVSINYKCFSSQKELRISYSSNGSFLSVKIKGLNSSLKLKLFDLSGRTVWQSNQLEPYLNDCNINIPKSYLRQPRVGEIITDKSRRLFFLTHFSD
jgi:6-phosphogluconolactonase (cycloisomerase 2 family)